MERFRECRKGVVSGARTGSSCTNIVSMGAQPAQGGWMIRGNCPVETMRRTCRANGPGKLWTEAKSGGASRPARWGLPKHQDGPELKLKCVEKHEKVHHGFQDHLDMP